MKKILFLILFGAVNSSLAAPDYIRFQGRLTDSNGRPTEGTPKVRFQIFNAPDGGSWVWGDDENFVEVNANEAGLFSADIGPFTSPDIFQNNENLYIEVTIKADTRQENQTLKPRQKITTVPYAVLSRYADTANYSKSVSDYSITRAKLEENAIGTNQIEDGSIQPIDISTSITKAVIPSGMIAMFAGNCPDDSWDRFDLMDNRFPMGVPEYNQETGGYEDISTIEISSEGFHSHEILPHDHLTQNHAHSFSTTKMTLSGWGLNRNLAGVFSNGTKLIPAGGEEGAIEPVGNVDVVQPFTQNSGGGTTSSSTSQMKDNGGHAHKITNEGPLRPPYLGVVYCIKK